jgi:hypothetical protein
VEQRIGAPNKRGGARNSRMASEYAQYDYACVVTLAESPVKDSLRAMSFGDTGIIGGCELRAERA